jgi:hypothetical protein
MGMLPRTSPASVIGVAIASCVLVVACNAISGIGDLSVESESDGGSVAPQGSAEGGAATRDAAPDVVIEPPAACPSAGRTCVPVPPPGWDGPLVVSGESKATPSCPANMALTRVDAHTGKPTGDHSCSPCTCGDVSGRSCTGTVKYFDTDDCSGEPKTSGALANINSCIRNEEQGDRFAIDVVTNQGTCPPAGGLPQKSPITWDSTVRGCGAPTLLTDGCKTGEVCAPDPPAGFRERHCITHPGEVACPNDTWPVNVSGFSDVDDTRGCTTCACTSSATCTGQVRHFTSAGLCMGTSGTIDLPSPQCRGAGSLSAVRLSIALTPSPDPCTPSTIVPIGALANKTPVTVCCMK